MKQYKIKEIKDVDLLNESKLEEVSMMVNTVQDAQETIAKCVTFIMKKKMMNPSLCMTFIGDGIISGIDSIDEFMPRVAEANPVAFQAKKRVISNRVARKLLAYSKTK